MRYTRQRVGRIKKKKTIITHIHSHRRFSSLNNAYFQPNTNHYHLFHMKNQTHSFDEQIRSRQREREKKIMNRKFTQLQLEAEFCQLTHSELQVIRSKWMISSVNKVVVTYWTSPKLSTILRNCWLYIKHCVPYKFFLEVFFLLVQMTLIQKQLSKTKSYMHVLVCVCVCGNNVFTAIELYELSNRATHTNTVVKSNNWKIGYFGIYTFIHSVMVHLCWQLNLNSL